MLSRRRSVRVYRDEPVPRDVLERIANDAVVRAPSGGFSQGLRLVVVTDPDTRRAIATAAAEDELAAKGRPRWKAAAPVHVVVLTREDDYHDRYRQPDKLQQGEEIAWPVPYWYADAGAAAMLIMLAAIDEGLAAGVFGIPAERMERVRELLELPRDVAIVEVITLGFPADDPASDRLSSRGTRPRRALNDIVRWESWPSES